MDDTLRYVLAAGVCVVVYLLMPRRWNLRVMLRNGTATVEGRALAAKAVAVRNYFQDEFADVRQAKVQGYWNGKDLRLHFRGDLSPGQRQRIRNYLLDIL